jgi:hypothetical protein
MSTHGKQTNDALFIPSLVLRGSRSARLIQLQDHLSHVYAIRRALASPSASPMANARRRSGEASSTRWFLAGAAIVLALALLTVGAWVSDTKALNGGEGSRVIGSIGVGFSY